MPSRTVALQIHLLLCFLVPERLGTSRPRNPGAVEAAQFSMPASQLAGSFKFILVGSLLCDNPQIPGVPGGGKSTG
jgi:hypothetical protein